MKKIYDSSKDTMEHIIKVGNNIDIIIEALKKYKKVDLIDNVNKMTLVDLLYLLIYGEDLPINNKVIKAIYNNSSDYKYGVKIYEQELLLKKYIEELIDRKLNHDRSKLEYPEKAGFDKAKPLKEMTYGSKEYLSSLYELRKTLEHHYRYNRHHPEHFGNGIYGMTIMDLIEMVCDWKAASERLFDSDVFSGIEKSRNRFNYDDKFARVLSNTCQKYLIGDKNE